MEYSSPARRRFGIRISVYAFAAAVPTGGLHNVAIYAAGDNIALSPPPISMSPSIVVPLNVVSAHCLRLSHLLLRLCHLLSHYVLSRCLRSRCLRSRCLLSRCLVSRGLLSRRLRTHLARLFCHCISSNRDACDREACDRVACRQ
jgi:hypothetical protein